MPLFDPTQLRNPFASCFQTGAYPPATKVETAVMESAYELERRGVKSETSTTININRGELEFNVNKGDFYRFQIPVVTATESYFATVDFVDVGAGAYAGAPLQEDVRNLPGEIVQEYVDPYAQASPPPVYESAYALSDLISWQDGHAVQETAPNYDFYGSSPDTGITGGTGYYQPDTAAPFVAPPRPPDEPPPVEVEQQPVAEVPVDIYTKEYLTYLASLEEDYYNNQAPTSYNPG